jgi:hypothetical protein
MFGDNDSVITTQTCLFFSFFFGIYFPELFGTEEATNPITGLCRNNYDLKEITQRNIQLYNRYRKRIHSLKNYSSNYHRSEREMKTMKKNRESLPIAEFR